MGSGEPLIFSLQHFCLHDGPGIRSLVFFKGCPLRCPWCQNAESWKTRAEIAFKAHLCIDCGICVEKCPEHAIPEVGKRNAEMCRLCFACAESCPSGALTRFGIHRTPEEIVEELRPEFPLLETSGGGVTFTGGEPALFPEFAARLAGLLRREGIDVALETCGLFDMKKTALLLHEIQLVLYDIKIFDAGQHRRLCGADNTAIKQNLQTLAEARSRHEGLLVWPRLPLVPGMTDGQDNLKAWAGFLRGLGIASLTIVPYHPMGINKRRWLDLLPGPGFRVPSDAEFMQVAQLFSDEGIRVCKPGEETF